MVGKNIHFNNNYTFVCKLPHWPIVQADLIDHSDAKFSLKPMKNKEEIQCNLIQFIGVF